MFIKSYSSIIFCLLINNFIFSQCQADFQYTTNGLDVSLINTSINAGSTLNSQTPTWDFGDGSPPITGLNSINYTYQNSGTYNICIDIFTWPTSWTTCSSTYCDSVEINFNSLCDSITLTVDNSFNLQSYLSVSADYGSISGSFNGLWTVYDNFNNLLFSDTSQNLIYNNSSFYDSILVCLETKVISLLDTNICNVCDVVYFDGTNWLFFVFPNALNTNFINSLNDHDLFKTYNFSGQEIKYNSSDFFIRKYFDGSFKKFFKIR
tara:strand:- start:2468 stop:3259 length:792 start_codon:yes stop_codon:yes gene_type:complete